MANSYTINVTYYSFSKIVFEISNLSNKLTKENLTITDDLRLLSAYEYTLKDNHPVYTIIPNTNFSINHSISFFATVNSISSNIISIYYSLITSNQNNYSYSLLKCKIPKDIQCTSYNLLITSLNNQSILSNTIYMPIYTYIDKASSNVFTIEETPTYYSLEVELKTSPQTSLPNGEYTLKTFVD